MNDMLIDNLKTIRREEGLTQREIAEKLGVVPSCYANWEQGRTEPDTKTLVKLARLFGISVDRLLGLEDDAGNSYSPALELTEKEKELLAGFRRLMPETQNFVLSLVNGYKKDPVT